MKVELIAHTPEPEKVIATAAKLCYSSSDISTLKDNLTDEKVQSFIEMLMSLGHESPVEHVTFTFAIEGISRACYDKDTQVLTDKGWKLFKDVDINNDLFCSLDDDNHISYVKAINKVEYNYSGKLDKYKSTQVDLCVTPNHRMWVFDHEKRSINTKTWKFIESSNMVNCRYGFEKSSKGVTTPNLEIINIPQVTRNHHKPLVGHVFTRDDVNLFLELLGIWVTDGCLSFGTIKNGKQVGGNRIYISQTKQFGRDRIEYLLNKLNIHHIVGENGYKISDQAFFDWLVANFIGGRDTHKTYYLKLPRWMFTDLSVDNMRHFIYGVFVGNGTHHVYSHKELIDNNMSIFNVGSGFNIYTCSENFANDLVEMALLCGLCGNKRYVKPRIREFKNGRVVNCKSQWVVSILTQGYHMFKTKKNKTQIDYNDMVYCVELEKYNKLYVMREGRACWCGNCSHQLVRHRIASYSQQSQRYVNMNKFDYIIPPMIDSSTTAMTLYTDCMNYIQNTYEQLRDILIKKNVDKLVLCDNMDIEEATKIAVKLANEDARFVLPNACETKIIVTMNIRSLYNFFAHRCCNRAMWEIRNVANEMLKLCYQVSPLLFKNAGPSCVVSGKCPEGKMTCGKYKEMQEFYRKLKNNT